MWSCTFAKSGKGKVDYGQRYKQGHNSPGILSIYDGTQEPKGKQAQLRRPVLSGRHLPESERVTSHLKSGRAGDQSGIRPIHNDDDQQRVMTPFQAISDGADYLVVGRPIRAAADPAAAAEAIQVDISRALAALI